MRRRDFITLLGSGSLAWPFAARAQQPATKIPRVGFMRAAGPNEKEFNAFRSGLRALGYLEGQNIVIEQRYAAGAYDRLSELAAELVRLEMDVIAVDGPPAAKAAKAATTSIPIVFTLVVDPVAEGLATSMARPGANLTGLTLSVGFQLAGKRVELLKDIKPDLARLAVLENPNQPVSGPYLVEVDKAGSTLGLTVRGFDARSPGDLTAAFAAMAEWRADGVITLNDGMLYSEAGAARTGLLREQQSHNRCPAQRQTGSPTHVRRRTASAKAGGHSGDRNSVGPSRPAGDEQRADCDVGQ
jgi:putative ABC transport system substrate-binding protein